MTNKPRSQNIHFHKDLTKGNIRIHNMLATMERTFLPVGSKIGKYRIIEEIDRGGMAVVYKAIQLDLDREVALKVMPANITINRGFVERFLTEAHAVAKLSHPNIVKIYEVAMENSIYYLSMEYIPGKNLYYYLNFSKPKLLDVLEIISQLAGALGYAHKQKIIHRDLKLNNVIMRDRLTPVLIDFGLAKAMENDEAGITQTGEIMGSPSYMAPERLLGGIVDQRCDICSLGIMLYEMLTFKNPYLDQRNLHQTTINVMEANPIPPRKLVPWLPSEIEAITLKAMAKDSTHRYQTMEEFRADINRYQQGEPVLAQPPSLWWKIRRFTKRHWAPLVISGLILTFSALVASFFYIQNKKEESHWQMVYYEKFANKDTSKNWYFSTDSIKDSTWWQINDGVLEVNGKAQTFARLERPFNRDMLIEFDLSSKGNDLYNAGLFLFGDRPDSGYTFLINRGGNDDCGIRFPGSSFVFRDVDPTKIIIGKQNHIVVERMDNSISMSVNGMMIARVYDFLPPLGKTHQKMGFFTKGAPITIDNLCIYRRAIPLVPSPTLIADRFWERGDIEAALDEYRGLQIDFSNSPTVKELKVKIADCLLRLQKPDEAMKLLTSSSRIHSRDENLQPRIYLLQATIYNQKKNEPAADSLLKKIAIQYSNSSVNFAALASSIVRIARYINPEEIETAEQECEILERQYPHHSEIWGKLHLDILKFYIDQGKYDKALAVSNKILKVHSHCSDVITLCRYYTGLIHLQKGKKDRATDLFNQCIGAQVQSLGSWKAWMGLGEIYEFDFAYHDALTIYSKVFREGPSGSPIPWMARLRMAELGYRDSSFGSSKAMFTDVAEGSHPFPLPRLIARFYLDEIDQTTFTKSWRDIQDDSYYLYYLARKSMIDKNESEARDYLETLRQEVSPHTYDFVKYYKVINNLNRW